MTDLVLEPLDARIERYRPMVIEEMRAVVGSRPERLFAWMRYHLGWEDAQGESVDASPGKMLRSTAVMLAAELVGGSAIEAAPAAAAVDLVHNFSLLHDDIEDDSSTRRGRATVWTFAGVPQAINTGDGMFTLARLAMHRLPEAGVEERRVVEAMRELDEASLRLVEGQYLDMAFERRADVALDEYVAMASGKTAAMFAAPFAIGALLGGASGEVVAAFRAFGGHVGLAFQALDDLLDCWGTRQALGKDPGGDLLARKKTYPVLAALQAGSGAERADLARRYATRAVPGEDYHALADLVEAAGGRAAAERWADEQVEGAAAALSRMGLDHSAQALMRDYLRTATGRA
jgi:geranylgeranyl diphosphate synthase type I